MNNKTYTLNEIINKEQFRVKLSASHYLLSGTNVFLLLILYLLPISFLTFCCSYLFLSIVGYRFIFSFTKDGKQYSPYLMKKFGNLQKKIRSIINANS